MDATIRKQNGVHYTPVELADFLARQTVACLASEKPTIRILDPACGNGQLLVSLIQLLQTKGFSRICVTGFDIDSHAVAQTKSRLSQFRFSNCEILNRDFLTDEFDAHQFDCVIANPPYVRTQVLGGAEAQTLAVKFKLTGRIDLYQAFVVAIHAALKPGGTMGLLTSNRFLTVKSGAAMRELLQAKFQLRQIFDLGDTKLFDASVLPAIVTGNRRKDSSRASQTNFHRVYQVTHSRNSIEVKPNKSVPTVLDLLDDESKDGEFHSDSGQVLIERGELISDEANTTWSLGNSMTRRWLEQVRSRQVFCFDDIVEIKVGIKTTADSVFIRDDWATIKTAIRPEKKLLRPLITHHDAQRWAIESTCKTVLYPYDRRSKKRQPIDLPRFPFANSYFVRHRERLEGRKYLIDSGRKWFEIWVPHQPKEWSKPKIVWPDISEHPKFFLDSSGTIVNGDCYWSKIRPDVDPDWLYLMLAVANSSVATTFYDTMFHNKLYAGRRRFMTQYVKEFPLPDLDSKIGKQIVRVVKRLIEKPNKRDEAKLEEKVLEAFGLVGHFSRK